MTWVKLDDAFFRNRKARLAGKDGRALFLASLCHCASALTDGHIGTYDLPIIAAEAEVKSATSNRLVECGLWLPVDDGWLIHDYGHYNRSADSVRSERDEGRKRAAASAARRAGTSGEASGEADAKDGRRNAAASPDPSCPVLSSGVGYMGTTSSSSPLSTDDDDESPWSRIDAERQADLPRTPEAKPIYDRPAWLREAARRVFAQHGAMVAEWQAADPDLTDEAIAARIARIAADPDHDQAERVARMRRGA